jgi:hypothetical protein
MEVFTHFVTPLTGSIDMFQLRGKDLDARIGAKSAEIA